ncbi:TIR domain-containing protein [Rhizobacter sp. Root404]|uniref:TIR domain-containing protein n=1 Tax=Rhizobacter sp. Root404 TaxID=1736528 RepID=UPI001F379FD7|nr:TIR domain-containing protein [Rhizobacter sp. Root404]
MDGQLPGTSVTVVLVGAKTDKSKRVKYEIDQSVAKGNGILTLDISKIQDMNQMTPDCCSLRVNGVRTKPSSPFETRSDIHQHESGLRVAAACVWRRNPVWGLRLTSSSRPRSLPLQPKCQDSRGLCLCSKGSVWHS